MKGTSSYMALFWKLCCLVCCVVFHWRSSSDFFLWYWNRRTSRLLVYRFWRINDNNRSSYVITFFFILITAAVLAETCSALPAAGSIYLYPSYSMVWHVVGQQKPVVPVTVVFSDSWLRGGLQLPGQHSAHPILKQQQIIFSRKSALSISLFPLMSAI